LARLALAHEDPLFDHGGDVIEVGRGTLEKERRAIEGLHADDSISPLLPGKTI
jgi:hypothetical protein